MYLNTFQSPSLNFLWYYSGAWVTRFYIPHDYPGVFLAKSKLFNWILLIGQQASASSSHHRYQLSCNAARTWLRQTSWRLCDCFHAAWSLNRYSPWQTTTGFIQDQHRNPVPHAVQCRWLWTWSTGAQLASACIEHSSGRWNTTSSATATVQLGGASFKHEEQKTHPCSAACWEWLLEWIPWTGWSLCSAVNCQG